jgi:hypothetical protein
MIDETVANILINGFGLEREFDYNDQDTYRFKTANRNLSVEMKAYNQYHDSKVHLYMCVNGATYCICGDEQEDFDFIVGTAQKLVADNYNNYTSDLFNVRSKDTYFSSMVMIGNLKRALNKFISEEGIHILSDLGGKIEEVREGSFSESPLMINSCDIYSKYLLKKIRVDVGDIMRLQMGIVIEINYSDSFNAVIGVSVSASNINSIECMVGKEFVMIEGQRGEDIIDEIVRQITLNII